MLLQALRTLLWYFIVQRDEEFTQPDLNEADPYAYIYQVSWMSLSPCAGVALVARLACNCNDLMITSSSCFWCSCAAVMAAPSSCVAQLRVIGGARLRIA